MAAASNEMTGLDAYILDVGYMQQQWADVQLTFFDQAIKLHRIVLSRSPYLAQVMSSYGPGSTIHLSFADDSITAQSIHIALHHLYAPASHLIDSENARAVLATAYNFGLQDLSSSAYSIIAESITHSHILSLVSWLSRPLGPSTSTQAPSSASTDGQRSESAYGQWSERLKGNIETYLVDEFPASLMEPSKQLALDPMFISIYAELPFDLFKRCVESEKLPVTPTQARFAFAKRVISERKKMGSNAGMEETVVLAIAGETGAVHVTRKPKKGRQALWKVEQ